MYHWVVADIDASHPIRDVNHVVDKTGSANSKFTLDYLNDMMIKMKRLNTSYAGGTPAEAYSKGITDLFVSPEIVGDIRALAYNPFSTTAEQVGDIVKDEMYKAAGANSIFGVNIIDLIELGNGQKYNTLFGTFYGGTFTGNDQVVVGVDRSREALVRPVARNSETGGTFTALPDDQFATRQDKTGFAIWQFFLVYQISNVQPDKLPYLLHQNE